MQPHASQYAIHRSEICARLSGEGAQRAAGGRMLKQGHTSFYNVAACNDAYVLVNQPRFFDVQTSTA